MKKQRMLKWVIGLSIIVIFANCVATDDSQNTSTSNANGTTTTVVALAIKGDYTDNYAGEHVITQTSWTNYDCAKTIVSFDNTARTFIYQEPNDTVNCYNANKFGKVYWTTIEANGNFYYCENVYGKNSAADAANDPSPPSQTTPASSGCGSFSWSQMTKHIEIKGNYTDNYAATYVITQTNWTNYGCVKTITSYDNAARSLIYQEANDAVNCYNANKFGKIYWTEVQANGSFYFCENVYGQANATDAANDLSPPSSTTPTTSGCGGFAWTSMTKN